MEKRRKNGTDKKFPSPLQEFIKDVELKDALHRIRSVVSSFAQKDDTILLVESEAYQTARLFYKSAKAAAQEGGEDAERIVKKLSYHHKRMGPSKKNDGDDTPAENRPDCKEPVDVDKETISPGISF